MHVDEEDPSSNLRSSITLFKSNRYCFNDSYHTSHHLNPVTAPGAINATFLGAKKPKLGGIRNGDDAEAKKKGLMDKMRRWYFGSHPAAA